MKPREPMYATVGTAVPVGANWTFEQKYDGMRIVALATAKSVQLVTRNGRDKSQQFPELVDALRRLARVAGKPLMLDGEVVALVHDRPAPFQALQSRLHLEDATMIAAIHSAAPAAFMVFDLLQDGRASLLRHPLHDRRARLERLLRHVSDPKIRMSNSSSMASTMLAKAARAGWEGIIAKDAESPYVPGARSRAWLKLKLQHRAEFVVGGYTEPRRSRQHMGALLLGYFDSGGKLCYAGHTGGGFTQETLRDVAERLERLGRRTSPFAEPIRTNEPAHWVRPTTVVEVKFAEWTADGKLRQPIFLGVRDDKDAREVHRERESIQEWGMARVAPPVAGDRRRGGQTRARAAQPAPGIPRRAALADIRGTAGRIIRQLDEIEAGGGDGTLNFGRGKTLHVTSLDKLVFPDAGATKGDVMRYYAAVSGALLPIMADRPLVLKRYPDGVDGSSFFQQNAGKSVPKGVRTGRVATEDGSRATRLIGGDLLTLLYIVQIGTIAVHTWQARVTNASYADSATIDLDPGDDVPFKHVVALAARIAAELDKNGLHGAMKTSGSSGIHIVMPLPAKTEFDVAARLAERIAERIANRHPDRATVERRVDARPAGTIYVDAQQNAKGKSVVAAYSLREKPLATVSAPLDPSELRPTLRLETFTIDTMPARLAERGDLWGQAMKRRNSKRAIVRALEHA